MTGAVMIHLQRALATGLRTSSSTCYLGKASAMGWCVGMRPVCHDNERRSACSSDARNRQDPTGAARNSQGLQIAEFVELSYVLGHGAAGAAKL